MNRFIFATFVGALSLGSTRAQVQYQEWGRMIPGVPSVHDRVTRAFVGDFDGNGSPDMFSMIPIVRTPRGIPQIHLNDGSGVFRAVVGSVVPIGAIDIHALGDFDRDGNLDVVGVSDTQQPVLWLGDGRGGLSTASATFPAVQFQLHAMAAGDVDGDGWLDLIVAEPDVQVGGRGRLFLGGPNLVFTDATSSLPPVDARARVIEAFDADGDGDLDLWFGCDGIDRLFRNVGGTFLDATGATPSRLVSTLGVEPFDGDGDGDLDLLILEFDRPLYFENQAGSFSESPTAIPWTFELVNPGSASLGDLDGDRDIDIELLPTLVQQVRIGRRLVNDGFGQFTLQLPSTSFGDHRLVDVDADGDVDALSVLTLALNDGTGTLIETTAAARGGVPAQWDAKLGDLDGDSDLDAFVFGEVRSIHRNDGRGLLTPLPGTVAIPSPSVDLADVDGDGDLDAIQARIYGDADDLLINDGSGRFTRSPSFPSYLESTNEVLFVDVDVDGRPDVIASAFLGLRYFRNQGGGAFADLTASLPAGLPTFNLVRAGDVDGDGDPDLVCTVFQDGTLLRNQGGTWQVVRGLPLSGAADLALGDLDGDGDLDAVTTNTFGGSTLVSNDGTGTFRVVGNLPASGSRVILFDDEADGDLDVVIDGKALFRNDGTGRFQRIDDALPLGGGNVVAGDLDQDGDEDLWVAGRLLWSPHVQVIERGVPRIGKPFGLTVSGPPLAPWGLFVSPVPASLPLPPLGVLGLSPGTIESLATGSLDANGRATFSFPIPNAPALMGAAAYAQALLGAPTLTLTNTREVRVTGF